MDGTMIFDTVCLSEEGVRASRGTLSDPWFTTEVLILGRPLKPRVGVSDDIFFFFF